MAFDFAAISFAGKIVLLLPGDSDEFLKWGLRFILGVNPIICERWSDRSCLRQSSVSGQRGVRSEQWRGKEQRGCSAADTREIPSRQRGFETVRTGSYQFTRPI